MADIYVKCHVLVHIAGCYTVRKSSFSCSYSWLLHCQQIFLFLSILLAATLLENLPVLVYSQLLHCQKIFLFLTILLAATLLENLPVLVHIAGCYTVRKSSCSCSYCWLLHCKKIVLLLYIFLAATLLENLLVLVHILQLAAAL